MVVETKYTNPCEEFMVDQVPAQRDFREKYFQGFRKLSEALNTCPALVITKGNEKLYVRRDRSVHANHEADHFSDTESYEFSLTVSTSLPRVPFLT